MICSRHSELLKKLAIGILIAIAAVVACVAMVIAGYATARYIVFSDKTEWPQLDFVIILVYWCIGLLDCLLVFGFGLVFFALGYGVAASVSACKEARKRAGGYGEV